VKLRIQITKFPIQFMILFYGPFASLSAYLKSMEIQSVFIWFTVVTCTSKPLPEMIGIELIFVLLNAYMSNVYPVLKIQTPFLKTAQNYTLVIVLTQKALRFHWLNNFPVQILKLW